MPASCLHGCLMAKIRPNDPCLCGSGKKYKKCCGAAGGSGVPDAQVVLRSAFACLHQGRYAEAVRQAEGLVRARVVHPDVFALLGSAHFQLGQFESAERALSELVRLTPGSAEAWANLGLVQYQRGNYHVAAQSCGKALELDADHAPAYNNLGNVFLRLGSLAAAEKNYRRAVELNPEDAYALVNLGTVLTRQGKFSEAEPLLRQVIARMPGFAFAHSLLGQALQGLGREAEALAALRKAGELEPDNPAHLIATGRYWERQGNDQQAEQAYRQALRVAPKCGDAYVRLAELHARDQGLANEYYARALEVEPGNAHALAHQGLLLLELGRNGEARDLLQRAIDADPATARAYAGLAFAAVREQQFDRARPEIERAVALDGDDPYVLEIYAKYLMGTGEHARAVDAWKRLQAMDPDNPVAGIGLANAYAAMDAEAEAETAFAQAAEQAAEPAEIYAAWAQFEEKRNRLERAQQLAQRAMDAGGNSIEVFRTLARLARRNGRMDEAMAAIRDAEARIGKSGTMFDLANLYFEKGLVLDKRGQYAEAFESFAQANRRLLEISGLQYDDDDRWLNRYIEAFQNERVQALSPLAVDAPGPQPVFVVGFPRSGTTLMERMLGAHPSATAAGELPYLPEAVRKIGPKLAGVAADYPGWLARLPPEQAEAVLTGMRDHYLNRARESLQEMDVHWFVDKLPLNLHHLGLIRLLFPRSPIIHMLRHPLDACLSAFMASFKQSHLYSNRIDTAAHFFTQAARLARWYRDHLDLHYKAVRYEDLVTDQERVLREVLAFIGLPWDEACLRFHESRRVAKTASYAQVAQAIYTSSRYRYKNYYEQLRPVFPIIEDTVKAYGYEIEPP